MNEFVYAVGGLHRAGRLSQGRVQAGFPLWLIEFDQQARNLDRVDLRYFLVHERVCSCGCFLEEHFPELETDAARCAESCTG